MEKIKLEKESQIGQKERKERKRKSNKQISKRSEKECKSGKFELPTPRVNLAIFFLLQTRRSACFCHLKLK